MSSQLFPRAGFLQFAITLGDPAANLRKATGLLQGLAPPPETLLLLPELWATGFDYARAGQLAEDTPAVLREMGVLAARHGVYLAGSLLEKEVGAAGQPLLFNTLYLLGPAGVTGAYRKQHLFSLWQEDRFLATGGCAGPIATDHGLVAGLVCYDLRFPETARRQALCRCTPSHGVGPVATDQDGPLADPSPGPGHRKPGVHCCRQRLRRKRGPMNWPATP